MRLLDVSKEKLNEIKENTVALRITWQVSNYRVSTKTINKYSPQAL